MTEPEFKSRCSNFRVLYCFSIHTWFTKDRYKAKCQQRTSLTPELSLVKGFQSKCYLFQNYIDNHENWYYRKERGPGWKEQVPGVDSTRIFWVCLWIIYRKKKLYSLKISIKIFEIHLSIQSIQTDNAVIYLYIYFLNHKIYYYLKNYR